MDNERAADECEQIFGNLHCPNCRSRLRGLYVAQIYCSDQCHIEYANKTICNKNNCNNWAYCPRFMRPISLCLKHSKDYMDIMQTTTYSDKSAIYNRLLRSICRKQQREHELNEAKIENSELKEENIKLKAENEELKLKLESIHTFTESSNKKQKTDENS